MLTRRLMLSAAIGLLLAAPRTVWAGEASLEGVWTGTSTTGALRVRFVIAGDDSLTVTNIAGGRTLPGRATAAPGDGEVVFDIPQVRGGGGFRGRRSGADRLVGVWRQGDLEFPLTLLRGEAGLAVEVRPEPPAVPLTAAALEDLVRSSGAPALTAAVARRGGKPRTWASGVRLLGDPTPVTAADQWHQGSNSKSMLATVIGRLVEQGRLSWDDTLGGVLGAQYPGMHPAYRAATLRHLLSHRASLPDLIALADMKAIEDSAASLQAKRGRYLTLALAIPPFGPLASAFSYSNTGYAAAAAMMEARTGQTWDGLMRSLLFKPLGLASAGFGPPGAPGKLVQPAGHGVAFGAPFASYRPGARNADLPEFLGPAGRVHMSMADMLVYLVAHRDRTGLLKPATWETLHTPPFGGDDALGWMVGPKGELRHSGSNQLWYAEMIVDRQAGIVAAAAANDGRLPAIEAVSRALKRAVAAG